MTKEDIAAEMLELGVALRHHSESGRLSIAAWYHKHWGSKAFSDNTIVTWYPDIFFPDSFLDLYDVRRLPTIAHELVHARRQKEYGPLTWIVRYLTSADFRYREERLAYLREVEAGWRTKESAIDALCSPLYRIDVPGDEMLAWFNKQI